VRLVLDCSEHADTLSQIERKPNAALTANTVSTAIPQPNKETGAGRLSRLSGKSSRDQPTTDIDATRSPQEVEQATACSATNYKLMRICRVHFQKQKWVRSR
jgi:hypothetical protein